MIKCKAMPSSERHIAIIQAVTVFTICFLKANTVIFIDFNLLPVVITIISLLTIYGFVYWFSYIDENASQAQHKNRPWAFEISRMTYSKIKATSTNKIMILWRRVPAKDSNPNAFQGLKNTLISNLFNI